MADPPTYRNEPDGEFADGLERLLLQRLTAPVHADARRGVPLSTTPAADDPDGGFVVTLQVGDEALGGGRDTAARRPRARWIVVAAAAAVVVIGAAILAVGDGDRDTEQIDTATPIPLTTPAPPGWVALELDGDIYLVRHGEQLRRLEGVAAESAEPVEDMCPTWSPDGTRLSFGRLVDPQLAAARRAELVIVPVGPGGSAGDPTVIALDGFDARFDPCAIWAPDGRWLALAGGGQVLVVDSHTGVVRHLPDLRPTDLEWRPGTDELAIAGDHVNSNRAASAPVVLYSVSADAQRPLGSIRAAAITWSPDGSTLAYTASYDDRARGLWLVDADGTDPQLLTQMGGANHGVGPVWSPAGDRIVYQRLLDETGEKHEVVLVDVADGSETVIEPPRTDGPNGPEMWFPWSVTWSPDGTTLLYSAWSGGDANGVLAVDADAPTQVTVLTDRERLAGVYGRWWVLPQMWGRQPG